MLAEGKDYYYSSNRSPFSFLLLFLFVEIVETVEN